MAAHSFVKLKPLLYTQILSLLLFAKPKSRTRPLGKKEKKKKNPLLFLVFPSLARKMAAASRKSRGAVIGSLSSTPRFCNSHSHSHSHSHSSSSSAFASSTSSFSRSSTFFQRSSSPTRVKLCGSSAPSVRFSLEHRSVSPNRSISVTPRTGASRQTSNPHHQKRTCMCSPTTHPGSFRCSLHKKSQAPSPAPYSPNRLNARRSAMTNSLVRIRGVEGDLVKRALSALIRPSSHQQRRRGDFHPRPSRLSLMSKADNFE
ncbi:hypothetical protein VNO78_23390 [Psophocarpus tetragonolobus]|uniref:Serine-rich protein-like protein n=1 Tax=Psophocarpus tetragonolobus TaxID=3891 RepID=A0AAN9S6J7_PSOTE